MDSELYKARMLERQEEIDKFQKKLKLKEFFNFEIVKKSKADIFFLMTINMKVWCVPKLWLSIDIICAKLPFQSLTFWGYF